MWKSYIHVASSNHHKAVHIFVTYVNKIGDIFILVQMPNQKQYVTVQMYVGDCENLFHNVHRLSSILGTIKLEKILCIFYLMSTAFCVWFRYLS